MIAAPLSWKHEFARSADGERYREIVRRVQEDMRRDAKRRKDKDDERAEEQADLHEELLDIAQLATAAEIESFHVTVNRYDAATYDALIANERLLDELYRQRDEMLEKAFVLPDGRRVFETEDGLRVFDEFGNEVDSSVATPEEIEDWRPKADGFHGLRDEIRAAEQDRSDLVDYHQKLADAVERADNGEITSEELAGIQRELAADMPESAREQLPPEHRPDRPELEPVNEPQVLQAVQQTVNYDAPTF